MPCDPRGAVGLVGDCRRLDVIHPAAANPAAVFTENLEGSLKFVKFRPPIVGPQGFPQIRLDRVLDFLIGDRLA